MKICILDGNKHGKIVKKIITELAPPTVEVELITVLDKGGHCTNDMLCQGLVYCLFNGVDIVNISLGLDYMSAEVEDIINKLCDKGVKVVCASGNGKCCYPALHPRTISVGAIDENGELRPYTVEGSYDVLEKDGYEVDGNKWYGTSFSCAVYVGKLVGRDVAQWLRSESEVMCDGKEER